MRTVVVTGAASAIGRGLAEGFAAGGWQVVGDDVDEAGLASLPGDRVARRTGKVFRSSKEYTLGDPASRWNAGR